MDTTKEYISMCEKAIEIQKLWNPTYGDYLSETFIHRFNCRKVGIYLSVTHQNFVKEYKNKDERRAEFIDEFKTEFDWLPRQDQLQEMLMSKYAFNHRYTKAYHLYVEGFLSEHMLEDVCRWCDCDAKIWRNGKIKKWWKSMEQLWLAFVMFENYSKIWDGKNWINEI